MPVPDKGADGRLVYRVSSLTWKKIYCFTESGKELPELDRLRPCSDRESWSGTFPGPRLFLKGRLWPAVYFNNVLGCPADSFELGL
jgi:hypothetical protein